MRVLIVDDSDFIRSQLKNQLEQGGYEVLEASNGKDALDTLARETVSLVTLDIEMPEMSGYEVCSAIREQEKSGQSSNSDVPVIFVTSKDSFEERMKGFQSGGADFVTKSNSRHHLLPIVDELLRPEKRFSDLKALIVDDGRVVRKIVIRALGGLGVQCVEAESGEQALEILQSGATEIDIIILDQIMPGISGVETCNKIRKELGIRDISVIFLTGRSSKEEILSIFQSGANDYIHKPFIKEEFLGRVGSHLQTRSILKSLAEKD
jgi:two-component system cell cycle response regulator